MRSRSAKEAKYGFGRLVDLDRSEPITVEKHGRVVIVMELEEFERLINGSGSNALSRPTEHVDPKAKKRKGLKQE